MTEAQKKAIEKLVDLNICKPHNLALIICGSLAGGTARPDSDVDLYLVVTDKEFARLRQTKAFFYGTWDPHELFGVCVDGKIVGMRFLRDAAREGSEPTRASFQNAYAAFCRKKEIEELIKKIPVYPESERTERIKTFYAYVKHYRYVGEEAFRQGNAFFYTHCVMEFIFFAGRLALAHNRVLFPCHKSLFKALAKCREMPAGFIEMLERLLKDKSLETMVACFEITAGYYKQYDYPDRERIGLILENEWAWFSKKMDPGEL
jgi:hypothetical protein